MQSEGPLVRTPTSRSGECVIIGGGPAGSTAAICLARAGRKAVLVEQHRFPRDKVCGECLSAVGIEALGELGLAGALRELGPVPITHVSIHPRRGRFLRLRLPRHMWGISRNALDGFLLNSARAAGASIRQPVRCEGFDANPPRVRLRDLSTNAIDVLEPAHLIVADGKATTLAGARPTGEFGIKAHFESVDGPRETIALFGCRGLYGGLAPIEGNRWNAAFSVPAERLRTHGGNIDSLFSQITTENATLACRLAGARRISPWLASPLPRFAPADHWPQDVIPIGNSAAAIEPIGGEGMGLAIRSAQLAAEAILQSRNDLIRSYRRIWNVRSFS
ncbi:MAG TPA: NAD(P)/FAD-dependent oxidoreductase, partial [Tepidisphaeraceae bacterium]|nr:NAD(P)/FAD-dependent oxidoreductase [Tepidisphaeraceae bacterium]